MSPSRSLPPSLDRLERPALLVGLLGLGGCALGFWVSRPHQLLLSYLLAYLFCVGIPLGCLGLLMLQHLTGGGWAQVLKRPLESGASLFPLMAVLHLPLLLGMGELYVWVEDPIARGAETAPFRSWYLDPAFFKLRSGIYFATWIVLALLLRRWSPPDRPAGDRSGDPRLERRSQLLSAGGLVLYGFTVSFAAVDWAMSLSPEWYSTVYAGIFMVGQGLGALALMVLVACVVSDFAPFRGFVTIDHLRDLGSLLLAFLMLWAYLSFSQFLIIWTGDLAEEVPFYVYRTAGGWKGLALFLIVFHFFLPFLLLLPRSFKRRRRLLALVAGTILLLRPVDLFWTVVPGDAQGRRLSPAPGLRVHWLDLAAMAGLGGISAAAFIRQLRRRPLLPRADPVLEGTAAHG